MSRLRTYGYMSKRSTRSREVSREQAAAYAEVDARSDLRCEVVLEDVRCARRQTEHHHVVKPRSSHNDPDLIVGMCGSHHDRCEWPFARGRLLVDLLGQGRFEFAIRYAKDKFQARV